ncbi:unnamed protein product [Nippostrongylus brasiliensis]|uniref:Ion_trans domain-containing protein n=1 Tax=Nippostrongylus brasiliensis TaxID=27835 RepID=A0A158QX85_NIPBR|nr:unnamed protein product [Nippostrongylus brasiliensis]
MVRGQLLRIPCYRLLFFNGFVDIVDLIVNSLFTSYFHFHRNYMRTVSHLNRFFANKSRDAMEQTRFAIAPYVQVVEKVIQLERSWTGASFNCMVLAINRTVEMLPVLYRFRFLFRGRLLYMWMLFSVLLMLVQPFTKRPVPFNTAMSAFMASPMISDDIEWVH